MSAFEPVGQMSRTDAAEQIIRGLAEGTGELGYHQAAEQLAELTGTGLTDRDDRHLVQAAIRLAGERLIRAGLPPMRTEAQFGWIRMTHEDLVQRYAAERESRGRRQFERLARAAKAADPEQLTGEARLKRDHYQRTARVITEIEARKARRSRPLPSAKSA